MRFEPTLGKRNENERPKNVFEMDTQKARYHIVYSVHGRPAAKETVRRSDAVVLENIMVYDEPDLVRPEIGMLTRTSAEYKDIIQEAAFLEKPIFFTDLSSSTDRKHKNDLDRRKMIVLVEYFLSGALIDAGIVLSVKRGIEKQDISRRTFLKVFGGLLASAHFKAPWLKDYWENVVERDQEPDEGSLSRQALKKLESYNYNLHPEQHSITFDARNDLIAQKTETLAGFLAEELQRKPAITLVIGASHSGIERSLKTSVDQRVENIKKFLGPDAKNEKTIIRADFRKREDGRLEMEVEIMEDPALAE